MNPSWGGRGRASRGRGRGWRGAVGGLPLRGGGSRRGGGPNLFQQHAEYLSNMRNRRGNYHGSSEHFGQMYSTHQNEPPSWPHFRERTYSHGLIQDYNSSQQGSHHRRQFLSPPPFHQSPVRPSSPLPGSEEYMQRDISEKSAFLKRQLELEEPTTIDTNISSTDNIFDQTMCDLVGDDFSTDTTSENFCDNPYVHNNSEDTDETQNKCDEQTVTKSVASPRRNKKPIKQQKQPEEMLSVEEIHTRIINHIANLSHEKKINFLNQSRPTGYDIAVQQITRQKRLELSKALRDICKDKFKETESTSQVIQAIIPDFDIKIEELPREVVEQLSSTLDEDIEGHVQNMSVDPELMFQQAANMLNTMLELEEAEKNNFNYAEGENALDNSDFDYPMLQNMNSEETDSSGNILSNAKDPSYVEAVPDNAPQIHSNSNPSYDESIASSSAMTQPCRHNSTPTPCKLSSSDFNSSLSVDFPTPPPVMYGVPPPPSLLDCEHPDIDEELSFPNNLIAPDGNFDSIEQNSDKNQYYSPGNVSSENSRPHSAAFNETQYYSPRNASSENSLPLPSVFDELSAKQNMSKTNYMDQPHFSSSLDIDEVNQLLQTENHTFSSIENGKSKQSFNLDAEVVPASEPSYNVIAKEQQYYPLNAADVSNILLPPNPPPIIQTTSIDNTHISPPNVSHNENSQLSDVLTEAAELEACLAQSNANFNFVGTNMPEITSKPLPESAVVETPDKEKQHEELSLISEVSQIKNNNLNSESEDKSTIDNELLNVKKDISVIKTTSELSEKCKEVSAKENRQEVIVKKASESNSEEKDCNNQARNLTNTSEQICRIEGKKDKKQEDEGSHDKCDTLSESSSVSKPQHSNDAAKEKERYLRTKKDKSRSKSKEKDDRLFKTKKKSGSEERNKEKSYKTKITDEHRSSAERCNDRSRYDLHYSQKLEDEFRRKLPADEDRHRRSDRDRSGDKQIDNLKSHEHSSEHSESHHYSKYPIEKEDAHNLKRYYHDSYTYRNEYPEYRGDYFNSQRYTSTSDYYTQPESQYISDSLNYNTNQRYRSKHEKQRKKRSKKRKRQRRNRSACSLASISSSERHGLISSHGKKSKHRSRYLDSTNIDDTSTSRGHLRPLKERIQVLCDFKCNRKRESSYSDYEEDRKIKSEPVSPDLSKEPSPERCRSIEKIDYKQVKKEVNAGDLRDALNSKNILSTFTNRSECRQELLTENITLKEKHKRPTSSENLSVTNNTETVPPSKPSEQLIDSDDQENVKSKSVGNDNSNSQDSGGDNKTKVTESRKPDQRPWKSPGEKKFMMEHLQRNPQLDEVTKINLECNSLEQSPADNFTKNQDVPDELVSSKETTEDEKVKSVEKTNSKSVSSSLENSKEDNSMSNVVDIKNGQNQFEIAPSQDDTVLIINSTSIETSSEKPTNLDDETKVKDSSLKSSSESTELENLNSSVETITPQPVTELPTTSTSKTNELSSSNASVDSKLLAESTSTEPQPIKAPINKRNNNKNTKNRNKSNSKTKEIEMLHSAEVSSTSDATSKCSGKSTTSENKFKSRSRVKNSLKHEPLDSPKNETTDACTKSESQTDALVVLKIDPVIKERIFHSACTQTDAEDDKDDCHKSRNSKKDKKHSSHKSDKCKSKNTSTQVTINSTNISTQTQNTRKNAHVQVDLLENKTPSKKSLHVQTDSVFIFENIEENDDFNDKSKSLDKSHRKILKAVRRRKTIERMIDLDREIERLTKMRQNMYKILNVDSDSDSDVSPENHTIKSNTNTNKSTTSNKDKHLRITIKSKSGSKKESKLTSNRKINVDDVQKDDRISPPQDSIVSHTHKKKSERKSKKEQKISDKNMSVTEEPLLEKCKKDTTSYETDISTQSHDTEVLSKDHRSDNKNVSNIISDIQNKEIKEDSSASGISTKEVVDKFDELESNQKLADSKQQNIEKAEPNLKSDKLILKIKGYTNETDDTKRSINLSKDIQLTEESEAEDATRSTRSRNKKPHELASTEDKTEPRKKPRKKTEQEEESLEMSSVSDLPKNDQVIPIQDDTPKKKGDRKRKTAEVGSSHEKDKNVVTGKESKEKNQDLKSKQKSDDNVESKLLTESKPILKVVLKPTNLKRKLEITKKDEVVCEKRNKTVSESENSSGGVVNELVADNKSNNEISQNSEKIVKLHKKESKSRTRKSKGKHSKISNEVIGASQEDKRETNEKIPNEVQIDLVQDDIKKSAVIHPEPAPTSTETAPTSTETAPTSTELASTSTEPASTSTEPASPSTELASTSTEPALTLNDPTCLVQENTSTPSEKVDDTQNQAALSSLESPNTEQKEVLNKPHENITEESTQSGKRKRSDLVEIIEPSAHPVITQDVLSPIKKTKKPKLETHSDREGGSPKKKKKYPFSGIKSGYTSRTKRRKSSSDVSNKSSPIVKNKLVNEASPTTKVNLPEDSFRSSIVNLTRYSISQLEKMRDELFNKSENIESAIVSNDEEKVEATTGKDFICKLGSSPDAYDVKIVSVKSQISDRADTKILSVEDYNVVLDVENSLKTESANGGTSPTEITVIADRGDNSKNNEISSLVIVSDVQGEDDVTIVEPVETIETIDRHYKMDFKGFTGAILAVTVIDSTAIAASDKGKIFYFNILDGNLTDTIDVSKSPITSMIVTKRNDASLIYAGSLDTHINVLHFQNKQIIKRENISEPVQCMEYSWNYVFIGSDRGSLIRYNLNSEKVDDTIKISDTNVLVMRATQEGPRKVLIVATRNAAVCIRDALSGLLLRTLETPFSPTVYTLLFEKNYIYCGTSQHDILVYTFEDGQLVFKYEATKSKGVVCMRMVGNLLFAGCYNGNIYIYNTKNNNHLGTMTGPGGLMLSMEIVDNKIIVGTKSSNFRAWRIPQKYLDQM